MSTWTVIFGSSRRIFFTEHHANQFMEALLMNGTAYHLVAANAKWQSLGDTIYATRPEMFCPECSANGWGVREIFNLGLRMHQVLKTVPPYSTQNFREYQDSMPKVYGGKAKPGSNAVVDQMLGLMNHLDARSPDYDLEPKPVSGNG